MKVRFEALRNLSLELIRALDNIALVLQLFLHPVKNGFVRVILVQRHCRLRLFRLLEVLGPDVTGIAARLDFDLSILKADLALFSGAIGIFDLFTEWRIPTMQFVFKFNRLHHALNDEAEVGRACTLREDLVQMQLGDAAELLRQQLGHLPLLREDVKGSVRASCRFLENPLEPCEPSASILQATVRLTRCERLLVRLQELTAELDAELIHSTLTN